MNGTTQLLPAVLVGLVQALTEFLPVSSSGHLVIVKALLKVRETGITLEVVTHFATVLAVVIYLRRRLAGMIRALWHKALGPRAALVGSGAGDLRLLGLVVAGSVPAAVLGFAIKDFVERLFSNVAATGAMLIVTGIFVLLAGKLARERTRLQLGNALAIGLAQAVAIIPGISRSGLTVGSGLVLGVAKREAFEFSLLLSIPAVVGATLLEALSGGLGGDPVVVGAAAAAAFFGGYLAISLLFRAVIRNKFHLFAYYLLPAGALVILATRLGWLA